MKLFQNSRGIAHRLWSDAARAIRAKATRRAVRVVTPWVGTLPIFAFLIEHPDGRYLVDTGETAESSTPGYLPWWNPFFTSMVEIKVAAVEEIRPRLQAMGIDPANEIEAVTLNHYHHDHTE
jgi:N-acyl homoserine lactone hydrolase